SKTLFPAKTTRRCAIAKSKVYVVQPIEVSKRMFRLPTEKAVFKKRRSPGYTPALPERAFKNSFAAEMPYNRGKSMGRVGVALAAFARLQLPSLNLDVGVSLVPFVTGKRMCKSCVHTIFYRCI